MDQSRTPLFDAVVDFVDRGTTPVYVTPDIDAEAGAFREAGGPPV
jgi:hypothetical protein